MLPNSCQSQFVIELGVLAARHIEVEIGFGFDSIRAVPMRRYESMALAFTIGVEIVAAQLFRQLRPCRRAIPQSCAA